MTPDYAQARSVQAPEDRDRRIGQRGKKIADTVTISLAYAAELFYIRSYMETQPQDTHPQDPIERFALHIEGLRRMPVPRGIARIVHWLLLEFFTYVLRVAAHFAEQRRNGTLPEVVPVAVPGQSRAWPEELRPRESGWMEQRRPEATWEGGTIHSSHSGASGSPGCPTVIAAAGMVSRLRGNDGVMGLEQQEIIAPVVERSGAPSRHVDDGGWPRWHGPGMVWTMAVGFWGFDSKKWGFAPGASCVHFVPI